MMVEPINQNRRDWLKALRMESGLKTREIAPLLGISFQHYNDIETGRRNPSIELSKRMAEFFNTPLEQFFEDRTKFKVKDED